MPNTAVGLFRHIQLTAIATSVVWKLLLVHCLKTVSRQVNTSLGHDHNSTQLVDRNSEHVRHFTTDRKLIIFC